MKASLLKLAALVVVIALAGCGGGGGSSGSALPFTQAAATDSSVKPIVTEQPPGKPAGCAVGFWGDSISGLTAPRIDKRLAVTLHAVIGGTAQAALPTFLQDPLAERLIAIDYGTNESNAEQSIEVATRAMLDRVKALGRTAVLTGLSNGTQGDLTYHALNNALAAKLAQEYGAIFADWASVPWSPADLMPDGVHPADAYQQRLADRLGQVILAAAPECGQ